MVLNPKNSKEMTLRFGRVVDHQSSSVSRRSQSVRRFNPRNLKWDLHINEVMDKASKRLHILRIFYGGVPPADLLKVYFALVCPRILLSCVA